MFKELEISNKQWRVIGVLLFFILLRYTYHPLFISIFVSLNDLILNIATFLLKILGIQAKCGQGYISLWNGVFLQMPYRNLDLKLIGILSLIITSNKVLKIRYLGVFVLWILIVHIIRIIIWGVFSSYLPGENYFEHDKIYRVLLCLFPLLLYRKNLKTAIIVQKKNDIDNILLKLCFVLFLYYTMSFIIISIGDGGQSIRNILVDWILKLSRHSLVFLGYSVQVIGRKIFNEQTYIFIDDECIGIDIMLVFCGIFLFYESFSWRLGLFCLFGVAMIFFLNAMRITYLFIFISENNYESGMFNIHHDIYNIFIYSFIVSLWYLWFFYYKKEDNDKDKGNKVKG